jgi:hypothetical protein
MFKRSALVFALLSSLTSFTSTASLITTTQTQVFSGTAGIDSDDSGSSPFIFSKFDSTLGTLDNIFIKYALTVDGGFIRADNLVDNISSGTGTLGATVLLSSSDVTFAAFGSFSSAFEILNAEQDTTFSLAADPSLGSGDNGGTSSISNGFGGSTGGDGDDRQRFDGSLTNVFSGVDALEFQKLNLGVLTQFTGSSSDTFEVDFNTGSTVDIFVTGAEGGFSAVDATISMDLYYEYTAAPVPPVFGVPEPAVFAFGLLMLCAVTGRKFIK